MHKFLWVLTIFLFIFSFTKCFAAMTGEEIYRNNCASCHGKNGHGVAPGTTDFIGKNSVLHKPDSVLLVHMINGYQSPGSHAAMPPKGGNPKLSEQDFKNVLKYIREKFRPRRLK